MDPHSGLIEFVRVAETGSFSGAGASLGISKSHVSNQVRRLEDRLGVRLLNRTTRKVTLTDAGELLFARAKPILGELEEVELTVRELQRMPSGNVSLSLPPTIGERYLVPIIAEFMRIYPDVTVDLQFTTRLVDLVEERFDLAIRLEASPVEGYIAKKLATTHFFVFGSPDYLSRNGTPKAPEDLRQHNCIITGQHGIESRSGWTFKKKGDRKPVKIRANGTWRSDNAESMIAAARQGVGLLYLPDFFVAEELERGQLIPLLADWAYQETALWLIWAQRRHMPARVRGLVDHIVSRFEAGPPWMSATLTQVMRKAGKQR